MIGCCFQKCSNVPGYIALVSSCSVCNSHFLLYFVIYSSPWSTSGCSCFGLNPPKNHQNHFNCLLSVSPTAQKIHVSPSCISWMQSPTSHHGSEKEHIGSDYFLTFLPLSLRLSWAGAWVTGGRDVCPLLGVGGRSCIGSTAATSGLRALLRRRGLNYYGRADARLSVGSLIFLPIRGDMTHLEPTLFRIFLSRDSNRHNWDAVSSFWESFSRRFSSRLTSMSFGSIVIRWKPDI